jgi:hypothetical protein
MRLSDHASGRDDNDPPQSSSSAVRLVPRRLRDCVLRGAEKMAIAHPHPIKNIAYKHGVTQGEFAAAHDMHPL